VLDVNQNGTLDAGDVIDGYSDTEAGFYVCRDTAAPGPFVPVELTYDLSGAAFDAQNTFYPANIASLGKLPLVVVSHGNGHNYQWYDHLGTHLASYGYVLMSHENNTGPGVLTAARPRCRTPTRS
jgi:predicted dienelactone hydrolase